ncbi:MAG: GIY-YIG nuclease family protein [Bacteroidota bacterium]
MKHYVYILYSESADRYYIGAAQDAQQRLVRHNAGASKATKSGRPWIIIHTEEYPSKSLALKREILIKKKKSRKYIEWLIASSIPS